LLDRSDEERHEDLSHGPKNTEDHEGGQATPAAAFFFGRALRRRRLGWCVLRWRESCCGLHGRGASLSRERSSRGSAFLSCLSWSSLAIDLSMEAFTEPSLRWCFDAEPEGIFDREWP
jgi:hypothetical protein